MSGEPAEAFQIALRGDLRPIAELTERATGWGCAARALSWIAQPNRWRRPALDDVSEPRAGYIQACVLHARIGQLELDVPYMREASERLSADASSAPIANAWLAIIDGTLAALRGDHARANRAADVVHELAKARREAVLLVESVMLSAIAAMVEPNIPLAVDRARRASFMAQSERLWVSHFTVSVLLARLRRLSGRPHLAGLIADSSYRAAPPLFAGAARWELLFAGVSPPERRGETPIERASTATADWLSGAAAPRVSLDEVEGLVRASAPHARDFRAALAAAGAMSESVEIPAVDAWVRGRGTSTPPWLAGLVAPGWAATGSDAGPCVVGHPRQPRGRRVLGFMAPPQFTRIAPLGARAARPEAVAAVMTLCGEEGISLDELFARAYGFAYRDDLHKATFRVVRHQAKTLLEPHADVQREGDRVAVRVRSPYLLVDPRTQRPLQDLVLRHLATHGAEGARDVAKRLNVPLRTVQMALRAMTEDGACVAVKEGRRVMYQVEDTTFCELTLV